jgi:hypothetical protein
VQADHVGIDGGFIYEDQTRRVQKALLADPAPPSVRDIWPFLLAGMQDLFLRVIPWRLRKRNRAVRLPGSRRLFISATISSSVLSFCSSMIARISSACSSRGERLPPDGFASTEQLHRHDWCHRIAELTLTRWNSADSRQLAPSSIVRTTRSRKSVEYAFAIADASRGRITCYFHRSKLAWESRFKTAGNRCKSVQARDIRITGAAQ